MSCDKPCTVAMTAASAGVAWNRMTRGWANTKRIEIATNAIRHKFVKMKNKKNQAHARVATVLTNSLPLVISKQRSDSRARIRMKVNSAAQIDAQATALVKRLRK